MKILLIDTSKPAAVVAVAVDQQLLAERRVTSDRTLGRQLLALIDELLAQAAMPLSALTRIAVHAGPGHFMALRTGVVTATSLAQALGIEQVGVTGTTLPEQLAAARRAEPQKNITLRYELL